MQSVEDALRTALEMERQGRAYYLQAARRVSDPVIKATLEALAHDEEIHEHVIRRYYEAVRNQAGWPDVCTDLPPPQPAKVRIQQIMEETASQIGEDAAYAQVYERARDLELKTRDYYREQADQAEGPELVQFFRFLAGMEQTHLEVLGLLLQGM